MISSPLRILLTGATGYIGGSVLSRLLEHPARKSWEIVSYSRNQEKANLLTEKYGVASIIGNLDESQKIEDAAANSDVVIHTAESADHIGSARAILRGLKRKFEQTGKAPIYIHTSGTGVIIDDAKGMHGNHTVYDDTDVEQLKTIPENAIHRNVDLAILAADTEGYVRAYIVLPSVIFGLATGPIFDAKLANPHSILVPLYVKAAVDRGRAGIVGEGKNVWPLVHIRDTAELFIVLLDSILSHPELPGHGWEGFYFADNGHFTYVDAAKEIGSALHKRGKVSEASPTTFTQKDLDKYFGGSDILGSNSRCISKRARALGWTPKYTKDDFFASIAPEIDVILASGQVAANNKFADLITLQASKEEQAKA